MVNVAILESRIGHEVHRLADVCHSSYLHEQLPSLSLITFQFEVRRFRSSFKVTCSKVSLSLFLAFCKRRVLCGRFLCVFADIRLPGRCKVSLFEVSFGWLVPVSVSCRQILCDLILVDWELCLENRQRWPHDFSEGPLVRGQSRIDSAGSHQKQSFLQQQVC